MVPSCAAANEGGDALDAAVAASESSSESGASESADDVQLAAIETGIVRAEALLAEYPKGNKALTKAILADLTLAKVENLSDISLARKIAKKKAEEKGRSFRPKSVQPLKLADWVPAIIAELKDREKNFATIRAAENAKDAEAEANAEAVDDVFALSGELWTPPEESAVDDDVVAGPAF